MRITESEIYRIAPGANKFWLERIAFYVSDLSDTYKVSNAERLAAFIANAAHETGGFTRFTENLNYRAPRLQVVFPSRFPTPDIAKKYGGNPEMIGNYIYANRMGNGNEKSGDGYKYRGRGIFQLTGKNNYGRLSTHIYDDESVLLDRPEDVATPIIAVTSALWFWDKNGLNELADKGSFELIVKKINGGLNGLNDRLDYWEKARRII